MGDQRPDARIRVSLTPITGQVKMPFSNDYITLVRVGHIVTACAYITLQGDFEQTGNMSVNETLPDGFRPSGDSKALMRGTDNSGAVSFYLYGDAIGNWMRLKDTIALLGIWEKLNNPDFKRVEFDTFMGEAGRNAFTMTPSRWITATNAIGIQSRRGRNGGTFAHVDLALDFAAWISPEFRLYVFQEYKRLKKDESSRLNAEWNEKRLFAAMNYRVHTDAIKDMMPPHLSRNDQRIRYAQEGDVLNIAVFGRTARQWRDANPNAKGNMRDYASITQNLVLSNLENLNAEMIRDGKSIRERMLKLNEIARHQMELFNSHPTVRKLEAEEHHHIEKPEVNENDDLR